MRLENCIFIVYSPVYAILVMPGDTLGMSGDQVGMNGDEGGRGWGVRRFGEWYSENKGLNGKTVKKDTNFAADELR